MKLNRIIAVAILALVTACATNPLSLSSPEAQIKQGADAGTAAATLETVLLRNDKISVAQAKSYRVMLGGARESLNEMEKTLIACRKTTGTKAGVSPDPCRPAVADVIGIALKNIADVKNTLDAK